MTPGNLFRPFIIRLAPFGLLLVIGIFAIHAAIRFGGIWNNTYIALSMAIIWPLPWLLSPKQARRQIGLKAPTSTNWFLIGPLATILVLAFCVVLAWIIFGNSPSNWFYQHALAMRDALQQAPANATMMTRFWIVTIPALIFSPLAEEFLYRGFMMASFAERWGFRTANLIQSAAFALVHLAHYGLLPWQPGLILVWVPSMFMVAWVFGWMVKKSSSLWPAVVAHSVFNLGMNAAVFLLMPELIV